MLISGVAALVALALTACIGNSNQLIVATYTPAGEGGFSALLAGNLTRSESGCLTVTGGSAIVPVFPEDATTVHGESIEYDGQTFELRDTISLVGGTVTNQDLPEECVGEGDVFIVSAGG